MTAEAFTGFRPAALRFLAGLRRNNRRDWFEERRHVYEAEVRAPMAAFVEEVDVRLAEIAPEIVGNPKRSPFRIHRDVRFSPDKSPYKTHAACWFHHSSASHGVGATAAHGGAGFYFHLEPGRVRVGGGIWMPPRPALALIRTKIDEEPDSLSTLLEERAITRRFGTMDEEAMLTRMPRGYPDTHPAAPLLRHQSFTLGASLPETSLASRTLPDLVVRDYALLVPFVRWLNSALGLRTLARR